MEGILINVDDLMSLIDGSSKHHIDFWALNPLLMAALFKYK
jgi:hypothetical protein